MLKKMLGGFSLLIFVLSIDFYNAFTDYSQHRQFN